MTNQDLIVAHGKIKRKIHGAFGLCASIGVFKRLMNQLKQQIEEWEKDKGCYGWMNFNLIIHEYLANTPVRNWENNEIIENAASK